MLFKKLGRPICLTCNKPLSILDIIRRYKETWVYRGTERVWNCTPCFRKLCKSIDEAWEELRKILDG